MGRLMDADDVERLMQRAMYYDNSEVTESNYKKIAKQLVDGIPTAYDIDKVVDEVKVLCHCSIEDESFVERLIEIIQKGGVE